MRILLILLITFPTAVATGWGCRAVSDYYRKRKEIRESPSQAYLDAVREIEEADRYGVGHIRET